MPASQAFGQIDLTLHALDAALKIGPDTTVMSNIFAEGTDSVSVANVRRLLIGDSLKYNRQVSPANYKDKQLFGNEIIKILLYVDSVNQVQCTAYIIKVKGSAIIDSITKEFGSIQLYGSFGKKLLSNLDIVEQVYFWDYDEKTTLMLVFFDKRQAAQAVPQINSDVGVITRYRKKRN